MEYTKSVKVPGEVIGLTEDFDLTPDLARFLELNQDQIQLRTQAIEEKMFNYRRFHRRESRWKECVLSYRFLIRVYDHPCRDPAGESGPERDSRVRHFLKDNGSIFADTFARYQWVARSEARAWWYIFWVSLNFLSFLPKAYLLWLPKDDFWRRNHDTISALTSHASDFDPHYPTSVAYTPLPRPVLENFLAQRGLFNHKPSWDDWLYHGFLNKIYLRLYETVFTPATGKVSLLPLDYNIRIRIRTNIVNYLPPRSWIQGIGHESDRHCHSRRIVDVRNWWRNRLRHVVDQKTTCLQMGRNTDRSSTRRN
jgi:hypothetical protein